MSNDDQLKMIRAERDFLHDMSNQLVISHGMSSFVLNALKKMDNPDEKWIAKLEKSTKAACEYLNKLYKKFNSWTLAAAAYNMGENGLTKQMDKQKVSNYYDLKLNNETSRYIFRIVAYKLIDQNPKIYGFDLNKQDYYQPLKTYNIEVTKTIDNIAEYAVTLNLNYKIIKYLNPWILKNKIEFKEKKYILKLPLNGSLKIK